MIDIIDDIVNLRKMELSLSSFMKQAERYVMKNEEDRSKNKE
jgi:hypothetical protein